MTTINKSIKCKESNKSVWFYQSTESGKITATAYQEDRYWFHIGDYKSLTTAIKKSAAKLSQHGYELEEAI